MVCVQRVNHDGHGCKILALTRTTGMGRSTHTNDGEHRRAYLANLDVGRVSFLFEVKRRTAFVPYLQSSTVPLRGHRGRR